MAQSERTRFLRWGDVVRLLVAWVVSAAALGLAAWLLDDLSVSDPWAIVVAAAVVGLFGLFVRPALIAVTARIGWIAVVLGGLLSQAIVVYLALDTVPGIETTFWAAFWASWIAAAFGTAAAWLGTSGTDDAFTSSLIRRRVPKSTITDPEVDGVVFVQIDGVPFPVLRWAIQAGAVPTIRKWVSNGDYHLREWTPQMPCTTPASQLGILHGTVDRVPAFRWYDRELGRMLVANKPADAAVIEERATNGRGLLADDGLSLSNLFTGDAERSILTMSRVKYSRGTTQLRTTFGWFLSNPQGFARGFVRTVAEIVKERWQAARQNRRDLMPRIERSWTFAALRAVTNVLLRDLNTAVISEEMRKGTKAIYVDYLDYDEIAHHAGMFRPETLGALDGVDRVLATLHRLASQGAARRYHFVILSDHGQSQGQSFEDRYGLELGELCSELIHAPVESITAPVEGWGHAEAIAEDATGTGALASKVADRAAKTVQKQVAAGAGSGESEITVLGSGNLGLLYAHRPVRMTLETIRAEWPSIIDGLRFHPGIGFVACIDDAGQAWAFGDQGSICLDTGVVEGVDPLLPFGDHAARVLIRAVKMAESPDLYINSLVDPTTLDVAAFEHLVGAHGGLGGWQDRAVLLVPDELIHLVPDEQIEGGDQLHNLFVSMLESLGHRRNLP